VLASLAEDLMVEFDEGGDRVIITPRGIQRVEAVLLANKG
jgi:hypothetical protein